MRRYNYRLIRRNQFRSIISPNWLNRVDFVMGSEVIRSNNTAPNALFRLQISFQQRAFSVLNLKLVMFTIFEIITSSTVGKIHFNSFDRSANSSRVNFPNSSTNSSIIRWVMKLRSFLDRILVKLKFCNMSPPFLDRLISKSDVHWLRGRFLSVALVLSKLLVAGEFELFNGVVTGHKPC